MLISKYVRKNRFLRLFICLSLLFIAVGTVWVRAERHQYILNRQLISALVSCDNMRALALVEAGADPNTPYKPLSAPSFIQIVKQLIYYKKFPVKTDDTAFMIACGSCWNNEYTTFNTQRNRLDDAQLTKIMLTHGARIDSMNKQGDTPLLWAVYFKRINTARILLDHGANANTSCKFRTILTCAFVGQEMPSPDLIRLLLEHGADPNIGDKNGRTPLMEATRVQCDPNIVRLLLEHGARANR